MEEFTVYVVQFWVDGYEYWQTSIEPSTSMFGTPVMSYEDEGTARARRATLEEANPAGKYRVIRRTTTEQVI